MKQRGYTYELRLGGRKDTPREKVEIWAVPISLHDVANRASGISVASALNRAFSSGSGSSIPFPFNRLQHPDINSWRTGT